MIGMLRSARLLTATAIVVLALGGSATAQPPEPAEPAPILEPAAFAPILQITGSAAADLLVDPGELTHKENLRKIRGQVTELTIDWSGPGLPSTIRSLWNSDEYEVPGAFGRAKIHAGTFLLRDDIGSWAGPFGGVEYVGGVMDLQVTMLGAAGYEGQCAILNVLRSSDFGWEMDGLVFDCRSLRTME